jgi:multidrug efflux pump subunit AcrB
MNVLFAIPMSLLGTIGVLYFAGYTLNTFTLLGLSLAVGLVVDDAVMVMENIFRHAESGKDRVTASIEGTHEITFAALAATIAVIAIFLPVAFMSGVVGRFFLQFGITLSVAVALSYVEAITLAPSRCAQMLNVSHSARGIVGRSADRFFAALARGYDRALSRALRWPWAVLGVALVVLGFAGFTAMHINQEFVPSQDQSRLVVRLSTAIGSDIGETDQLVRRAEAILAKRPEIERVLTNVSSNSGNLSLSLVPPNKRKQSQAQISNSIRNELNAIPGLRASVQDLSQQGFSGQRAGKPVDFSVRGADWDTLVQLSKKLETKVESSGLAVDVESDYQLGAPQIVVEPERERAVDVGINVQDIATTINALMGGVTVGQYSTSGRRVDLRMRLLADQRTRPEDIGFLRLRAPTGDLIPLSSVATTRVQAELQSINHQDRDRAIRLTGNVAPGHSQQETLAFVQSLTKDVPPGYAVVLGGQSSQFGDTMSSLLFALLVGILVAYMVLASQFNSLLHAFTVLTILPLSVAGAVFALFIAGKTFNVFSMIGLLLLMGIVKKNSIILVDYANELRKHENLGAHEAMQRAGPVRLRPILMTAVATMMAAVPSSLGIGPGAETRAPMADAVIGGLLLSTALSLFVVPAFYVLADRAKDRVLGRKATPIVEEPRPSGAPS